MFSLVPTELSEVNYQRVGSRRACLGACLSALAATPQRGRVKTLASRVYSEATHSNPSQSSAPKANTHTGLQWQMNIVQCLII